MESLTSQGLQSIRAWLLTNNPERQTIGHDEDLIDSRLVDSLSFVDFIFRIEEASGNEVDMDTLDLDAVRTLSAIEKYFGLD